MDKNYKKELDELVNIVIREDASDIHISEGRFPTIRISGSLVPLNKWMILTSEDINQFLFILIDPAKREVFFQDKELDFSYDHDGVRFRGNCFFQSGSISIALRKINTKIFSLDELNLPSILETFSKKQQGLFLVVGPTGHGKSTTLSSIVDLINTNRTEHIITIEDPIEFLHQQKNSIIDQREVKIDTVDFPTALRSSFRQDIDVILVGEMRGAETISTAITAAETGHLVLSTLHTNSASQTIDRIIDSFPPEGQKQIREQLSNALTGIFSQRLIPSISGGRVPAFELLIKNNAVANLIREGRTHEIDSFIETSSGQGMISMNRSLTELVRRGDITIEDAYAYTTNTKNLERLL